jgi:hypothetical protein
LKKERKKERKQARKEGRKEARERGRKGGDQYTCVLGTCTSSEISGA